MKKSATAGTHFNARVVECRLAAKVCLGNSNKSSLSLVDKLEFRPSCLRRRALPGETVRLLRSL